MTYAEIREHAAKHPRLAYELVASAPSPPRSYRAAARWLRRFLRRGRGAAR